MNPTEMELPDPEGVPQSEGDKTGTAIWISFAAVVALGVMIAPSVMSRGHCRGASRSTRLKWEERQAEIQQAMAENSLPTDEPRPNQH
jgi:hypothetical protein